MISKLIFIAILTSTAVLGSPNFASAALKYDASNYDVKKGCFDPTTKTYGRIQLSTAAEIQARLESKDFECTEMSDVLVETDNNRIFYSSRGPGNLKIVFLKGSGGALGKAGVAGFNFDGAKITNLFLDYMARMKGSIKGLNVSGVYLAFYALFNPDSCLTAPGDASSSALTPYAISNGSNAVISLGNKVMPGPDARIFDAHSLNCNQ